MGACFLQKEMFRNTNKQQYLHINVKIISVANDNKSIQTRPINRNTINGHFTCSVQILHNNVSGFNKMTNTPSLYNDPVIQLFKHFQIYA